MQSDNPVTPQVDAGSKVSRRRMVGGVGAAVAGGLVAGIAGAAPAGAGTSGAAHAGSAKAGDTVFEFVCRIGQDGQDFTGHGYLTAVAGTDRNSLFVGEPRDEAHARYLLTADGQLVARSVDGAVHALNIEGHLAVHYSQSGGAAWSNAASFTVGSPIATFDLELQDVLTVILPSTGIPTLNGVATQTRAARGHGLGRPGLTSRFTATGIGNRSDSGPIDNAIATLVVAGSMIAT